MAADEAEQLFHVERITLCPRRDQLDERRRGFGIGAEYLRQLRPNELRCLRVVELGERDLEEMRQALDPEPPADAAGRPVGKHQQNTETG